MPGRSQHLGLLESHSWEQGKARHIQRPPQVTLLLPDRGPGPREAGGVPWGLRLCSPSRGAWLYLSLRPWLTSSFSLKKYIQKRPDANKLISGTVSRSAEPTKTLKNFHTNELNSHCPSSGPASASAALGLGLRQPVTTVSEKRNLASSPSLTERDTRAAPSFAAELFHLSFPPLRSHSSQTKDPWTRSDCHLFTGPDQGDR